MWAAAVLIGWVVCLPFLGPYGALAGAVPTVLVFSPLLDVCSYGIRHLKTPGLQATWSPRLCRAPRSVASVVANTAAIAGLLWLTWPFLGSAGAAVALGSSIVYVALVVVASGTTWQHTEPPRPGEPPRVPPAPSVTLWALAAALLLGVSAWALRRGVLPVAYGTSAPDDGLLREADRQLQNTLFGPSVSQSYWPLLVAGAGLVAGGVAAALRTASLTRATKTVLGPRPAGQVFLSYARADKAHVLPYVKKLKEAGQDVWVDWEGIKPSREWREELAGAIRSSDALVVLVSPNSLKSPYCWDECRQALDQGKRVLPVVVSGVEDAPGAMEAAGWGELTRFQLLWMRTEAEFGPAVRETLAFVTDEHEWVAQHTRLGEQAYSWQHHRHSPAWLLRRHELVAAETWLAHQPGAPDFGAAPTAEQRAFIEASRRSLRRRRTGVLVAGSAAVAALVAVASLVVVTQEDRERQNREELSRTLAQASDARPYPGLAAAARFAAAAYGQADTTTARAALQRQLLRFQHAGPLLAAESPDKDQAFSADSSTYAATVNHHVRIWSVPEWTVRRTLKGILPRDGARALSADGKRVLVYDDDGRATVVDTRTGRAVAPGVETGTKQPFGGLTPDGQRLVTSTGDGAVIISPVEGGGSPIRIAGCAEPSLSPHGRYVWCSADYSETGMLVSVGDGTHVAFPQRPLLTGWTYDDRPVASLWPAGNLTAAQVLDPAGPDRSWTLRRSDGWQDGWEVAAVSPDGTRLALRSIPGTGEAYEIWDIRHRERLAAPTREELEKLGLPSLLDGVDGEEILAGLVEAEPVHGMPLAYFDIYDPVLYSPDGRAAAVDTEEGLRAWRLDGWGRLVSQAGAAGIDPSETQGSALSPDGSTLAVASDQARRLTLYDVRTGRRIRETKLGGNGINVAYSPDGRALAVGELTGDYNGEQRARIGLFTAASLHRTATLNSPSPAVYRAYLVGLAFSPDGGRVYLAESQLGSVREWRVSDRRLIRTYSDPRTANFLDGLALSPDGSVLATSDRQRIVTLWNTRTGKVRYRIPEAGHRVAFSPDGRRIVMTGFDDGADVAVWDVAARKRSGPLLDLAPGGGEVVSDVVFTPDGRGLLVASFIDQDDTSQVRRWELNRQSAASPVLARLRGQESQLHVSSDGRQVVAPGEDSIVRIVTDPAFWQRSLCELAGRWIRPQEWQAVAPDQRYPTHCAPPPGN